MYNVHCTCTLYNVHAYNRHKQYSGSQIGPRVSSTVGIFILEDVSTSSTSFVQTKCGLGFSQETRQRGKAKNSSNKVEKRNICKSLGRSLFPMDLDNVDVKLKNKKIINLHTHNALIKRLTAG